MEGDTGQNNFFDVIIIGAGVSGLNSAYRLQTSHKKRSYTILESRQELGGTWSFWKYPGFRNDSHMTAYGFPWHKWHEEKSIRNGDAIIEYVNEAAQSQGIDKKVRFSHRVDRASWNSSVERWRLEVTTPRGLEIFEAKFLLGCGGYYDYKTPLEAQIPGLNDFKGTVAVPQFWPQDLDYTNKKVVLIGSGATAITLVPVLAEKTGSLTMLQRSPSYVMPVSTTRWDYNFLRRFLPRTAANFIIYWVSIWLELIATTFLQTFPRQGRKFLMKTMKKQLPKNIDVEKHFNPKYNPFEQRLGLCPDGDFFKAFHKPNVDIVTDVIDTVTPTGIKLRGGKELEADIIVPATGLKIKPIGGFKVEVDDKTIDYGSCILWRGCMVEGVPNFGVILGYFQNSWTPGADIGIKQIIAVMDEMDKRGATKVVPHIEPEEKQALKWRPFFKTNATYIMVARDRIPKVSDESKVWTGRKNWLSDSIGDWMNGVRKGLVYTGRKIKNY